MSTTFGKVTKAARHYIWRGTGHYRVEHWSKTFRELGRLGSNVLLDLRDLSCGLTILDAYLLAEEITETTMFLERRVALVIPEEDHRFCPAARFFALCGTNRGLPVRTFEQENVARTWVSGRAV